MRRKIALLGSTALLVGGLAACTSLFGGETVKIRPIESISTLPDTPHNKFYEGAVSAINVRDYARALDYLQEARARDPRDVKVLNALGVVYDKLGRFDLSARYYAQARTVEPASRIVAENLGYSRFLQGLLNPGEKVASATIDLSPDLNEAPPRLPAKVISDAPVAIVRNEEELAVTTAPFAGVGNSISAALAVPSGAEKSKLPAVPPVPASPPGEKRASITSDGNTVALHRDHAPAERVNRKIFTIGQPIRILDASGKSDGVGVVTRRLGMLGWTVRQSKAGRVEPVTTLFYPAQNGFAAKAMERTLPFPVRLVPGMSTMQLVIGRDYLSWKPKNARLGLLWQRRTLVAMSQRSPTRGGH